MRRDNTMNFGNSSASSADNDNNDDNDNNNDNENSSSSAIHSSHVATTASSSAISNSTTNTTITATATVTTAIDGSNNEAGRKRLRSVDATGTVGRLKCEEDFDDDGNDDKLEYDGGGSSNGSKGGNNGNREDEIAAGNAGHNKNKEGIKCEINQNDENSHVGDLKDGKEKDDVNRAGDSETTRSRNVDCTSMDESTDNKPSSTIGKRKSQPRKLPPHQIGTTIISAQKDQQNSPSNTNAANSNNGEHGQSQSDDSSDDEEDESFPPAAIIASLLRGELGPTPDEAMRAYLARHGTTFDPSDAVRQRFATTLPELPPSFPDGPPSFPRGVAGFLRSPGCRSVVVLAGAGMSVSSGIPDFRSAGVGLYDTLRPELLTASELERALIEDDPTLALDKVMFLQNPLPMLELKRSFILGTHEKQWKATLAHRVVELLHSKLGKLTRLYTQNIDGLEAQCADLPREMVVNVHGSMGAAACEHCGSEVDFDEFCEGVRSNVKDISGEDASAPRESSPIFCEACGGPYVKPTIVLFRGSMPREFHVKTASDLPGCDLLIVVGTSLTVAPANGLVCRVPPTALRMVMNDERVGRRLGLEYGEDSTRDVFAHGRSDETCLDLAEEMGWLDDLALVVDELPEGSARLLRERLARRQLREDE